MPHVTHHGNHTIQASKWGNEWEATATEFDARAYAETPEEAIKIMKEAIDAHYTKKTP